MSITSCTTTFHAFTILKLGSSGSIIFLTPSLQLKTEFPSSDSSMLRIHRGGTLIEQQDSRPSNTLQQDFLRDGSTKQRCSMIILWYVIYIFLIVIQKYFEMMIIIWQWNIVNSSFILIFQCNE